MARGRHSVLRKTQVSTDLEWVSPLLGLSFPSCGTASCLCLKKILRIRCRMYVNASVSMIPRGFLPASRGTRSSHPSSSAALLAAHTLMTNRGLPSPLSCRWGDRLRGEPGPPLRAQTRSRPAGTQLPPFIRRGPGVYNRQPLKGFGRGVTSDSQFRTISYLS